MIVITNTVAETYALGRTLGAVAPAGLVIALEGQLGAGKTHLVRGIAQGARVADPELVSSPTYVLVNVYRPDTNDARSKTIYHVDAYRLAGAEEFIELGFEEWLEEGAVVVVEWASRIFAALPEDKLTVAIDVINEESRQWTITAHGDTARDVLAQWPT